MSPAEAMEFLNASFMVLNSMRVGEKTDYAIQDKMEKAVRVLCARIVELEAENGKLKVMGVMG
jgi:prefoldin subunit 5